MLRTKFKNHFVGFSPSTRFVRDGTIVEKKPTRSVWDSKKSRILCFFARRLLFALLIKSVMRTPEGQTVSHRLQLLQYASELSARKGVFILIRSASGPEYLGPGYRGVALATGQ